MPLAFSCILQVCGRDGNTYDDMQTMRTRGGNVDPDYMGRCMEAGNTPNEKCMMVRENNRCPNVSRCPSMRRVRPADGCCPICGKQKRNTVEFKKVAVYISVVQIVCRLHAIDA